MQAAQLLTPDCFTCLKKLGEIQKMRYIGNGVYHCDRCKQNKALEGHAAFHPMGMLSLSALPLLNVAYVSALYLLNHMPLALQLGMGAFLLVGYMRVGLRTLGR